MRNYEKHYMNGIYVPYKKEIRRIKNLFKLRTPFKLRIQDISVCDVYLINKLMYQSVLIKHPSDSGIDNADDIYYGVEPFLRHLASKHATDEHERYSYGGTEFVIEIRTKSEEDDSYNYDKIIEVNVEHTIDGITFKFDDPNYIYFNP